VSAALAVHSAKGCDNYRKLPKSTENLPKTKLPKTNLTVALTLNPKPLTLNRI